MLHELADAADRRIVTAPSFGTGTDGGIWRRPWQSRPPAICRSSRRPDIHAASHTRSRRRRASDPCGWRHRRGADVGHRNKRRHYGRAGAPAASAQAPEQYQPGSGVWSLDSRIGGSWRRRLIPAPAASQRRRHLCRHRQPASASAGTRRRPIQQRRRAAPTNGARRTRDGISGQVAAGLICRRTAVPSRSHRSSLHFQLAQPKDKYTYV
jgi:hypothetical protein